MAACTRRSASATTHHAPCIFEYVYFARPDSLIDNISVHRARMRMGERLAEKILRERADHDIDVVIPIPDTSRTSAMQVAQHLDVKYREGFVKNRYVGRTFIMPGQEQRSKSVRSKLNAIDLEFRNKNVLLVDDSIVRGTTSAQIIDLAREAGAKKVYFASAAPPVKFPNVYGIDMPAASELVASNRTDAEVAEAHRRRLADLPGSRRPHPGLRARSFEHQGIRHLVFLGSLRHRRRHARIPRAPAVRTFGLRQGLAARRRPERPQGREDLSARGRARPIHMNARRILLELFDAALRAVDGRACVARFLRRRPPAGPDRGVRHRQGRERHGARRARRARWPHRRDARHHQGWARRSRTSNVQPDVTILEGCTPGSGCAQPRRWAELERRLRALPRRCHAAVPGVGRQLESGRAAARRASRSRSCARSTSAGSPPAGTSPR